MLLEELDDLPDLVVEAGALRWIARGVVETGLLAEARREDEMERGNLALKLPEPFVQPHHHILGRKAFDARDLLRGIGRLAKESELQPDGPDVGLAVEPAAPVRRGRALGLARGQGQLREVEDLGIAIEAIVIAEADQAIDGAGIADRQRIRPVDLGD